MLSKDHRLKKSSDFERTYKKGEHLRCKYGKLIYLCDRGGAPARIGIVTPAKIGKANVRNLAKRRIREAFRSNISKIPSGCDVEFIVWDGGFTFDQICHELESMVSKIKVVKK